MNDSKASSPVKTKGGQLEVPHGNSKDKVRRPSKDNATGSVSAASAETEISAINTALGNAILWTSDI